MTLPRPCLEPRCPNTVTGAQLRCATHERPDTRYRDPQQYQFYRSRTWRELRASVLRGQPLCGTCGVKPATQVHHVDGDWKNNDAANLQPICTECHRTESGRAHQAKRGQGPTQPTTTQTPTTWVIA